MITLADLRALLERALTHAENPAIVRLTDRTVEGLARAYLPRWLPWVKESRETDPGTAHALLVALALALGLDPGVGGLAVMWFRDEPGWSLTSRRGTVWIVGPLAMRRRCAPEPIRWGCVAAEPDPIKALALAVRHLLENP